MSRFGSYLSSQKLAKAHLAVAEDRLRKGAPYPQVLDALLRSVREFQTATNCLASMMFEPRRKRGSGK